MFPKFFSALRKPSKNLITLTPAAEQQLRKLYLTNQEKLLRLSLKQKGCSGLSYSLEFTDKINNFDEIVEQNGLKFIVDSKAIMPLIGTQMDYSETELNSEFVFNNPNVKDQCGCGQSFSV